MRIVQPSAELIWITPNTEKVVERAGRTCYKSEDKITQDSAQKFIAGILKAGHESVIEHACASIRFICDRAVANELVRHRLASYSQESTRYCNYGKEKFGGISVIEPPGLSEEKGTYKLWYDACLQAEKAYLDMLEKGVSPQMARSVLPSCLKTEIVVTANLREWRHIFKLRISSKAHPQIRELMELALELLKERCPAVFGEFGK